MTNQQAAEKFNEIIIEETDQERIAKLELLREYFTNQDFREALHNEMWEQEQN